MGNFHYMPTFYYFVTSFSIKIYVPQLPLSRLR